MYRPNGRYWALGSEPGKSEFSYFRTFPFIGAKLSNNWANNWKMWKRCAPTNGGDPSRKISEIFISRSKSLEKHLLIFRFIKDVGMVGLWTHKNIINETKKQRYYILTVHICVCGGCAPHIFWASEVLRFHNFETLQIWNFQTLK